jgi:hypothetical protein
MPIKAVFEASPSKSRRIEDVDENVSLSKHQRRSYSPLGPARDLIL